MDSYKITRKEELEVAYWSGGTTRQLAIWPEDAVYSERNFIWRISSARVESEESEFTHLPGVTRCLMVLEGELYLSHEGHYDTVLERFGQDNFDGGWKTSSRGMVTDFNLMTTAGEGRVQMIESAPCSEREISLMPPVAPWKRVSEVFYVVEGVVGIGLGAGEGFILNEGDVLTRLCEGIAEYEKMSIGNVSSGGAANIIRTVIYHS